jgi:hypothetical protein
MNFRKGIYVNDDDFYWILTEVEVGLLINSGQKESWKCEIIIQKIII